MLIVFVTNKIISIDTILPILVEAKQCNNQTIIIVVSRKKGVKAIEENIVINDMINKIGFKFLFGGRYRNRWYKRTIGSIQFLLLFIAGIFRAKFIHFDVVHTIPLKILSFFFSSRIFYSEKDATKNHNATHYNKNKFGKVSSEGDYQLPLGSNIISYYERRLYYYFGHKVHENRNVYHLGLTRARDSWVKYINDSSNYYFNKFHKGVNISNGIIFIVLTFYDLESKTFNEEDRFTQRKLRQNFENTVDVLSNIKGDIPVFLKPHSYTDLEYVNSVLSGYSGFHITYLHPSMLIQNARFVICNYFSTILVDAHNLGVTTIEYTYYQNYVRKAIGDGSEEPAYVDWFIYDNKDKFRDVVTMLIDKNFKGVQLVKGYNQHKYDALLTDLC